MGRYSAEQAGHLVAEWTMIRERLRRRLRGLDSAIDLDGAVRILEPRLKKRIAKLVRESYQPERVNDKYPEPADLLVVIEGLKKDGKVREAAYVSRTIRDIRLLRALAWKMSGRRERRVVEMTVNRRLESACSRCDRWCVRGEKVYWDRDRGEVWHREHGPEATKSQP